MWRKLALLYTSALWRMPVDRLRRLETRMPPLFRTFATLNGLHRFKLSYGTSASVSLSWLYRGTAQLSRTELSCHIDPPCVREVLGPQRRPRLREGLPALRSFLLITMVPNICGLDSRRSSRGLVGGMFCPPFQGVDGIQCSRAPIAGGMQSVQ